MSPTISVVIPAYNAADYIGLAVESVLTQTRTAGEIILVDDGSKDDTGEIAKSYGNRIRYIRQNNAGVMTARNRGIQEARFEWIAFLDADDFWFPEKLARQCTALAQVGEHCLLCGAVTVFRQANPKPPPGSDQGASRPEKLSVQALLQKNRVATSTVLVPKESLQRMGGFPRRYNHAEDWAVWLRIAAGGLPIYFLSQPLCAYRLTPNALGTRDPGYLRDVEVRIITDFLREHPQFATRTLLHRALAGNHIRTAYNYDEIARYKDALGEVWHSLHQWPFTLPEYSPGNRFLRLRLIRRFLTHWARARVHHPIS